MTRKLFLFSPFLLLTLILGTSLVTAQGPNPSIMFADPVGDHNGTIDIVSMELWFSNTTGDYEILLTADPANPFVGEFRININLFNPDTGFGSQNPPSVFQDVVNDFNLADSTTTITLTGMNSNLLFWEAGDRVATNSIPFGNPDGTSFFRSAVLNRPFTFLTNEDTIAYGNFSARIELAAVDVDIDVKPDSDSNTLNPRNKGVIPVAILTTADYDATTIDPLSVEFGPDGATETHSRGHIEDVDGDGDLDLLLHFRTQETGIQCGDTSAALTGETFDGQAVEGSDSIWTVNCD